MPILTAECTLKFSYPNLIGLALECTNEQEFFKKIIQAPRDKYEMSFSAVQKKKLTKIFNSCIPSKVKRFIYIRAKNGYTEFDEKVYADVYTIIGVIKSGTEIYFKTEMPEDTAVPLSQMIMSYDQWSFLFAQIKKFFNREHNSVIK